MYRMILLARFRWICVGFPMNRLITPTLKLRSGLVWRRYLRLPTKHRNLYTSWISSPGSSQFTFVSMGVLDGLHSDISNFSRRFAAYCFCFSVILLSFCSTSMPRWYKSLPPIAKTYGTLCVMTTALCQLQLLHPYHLALFYDLVLTRFQIWRLVTSFFFLGKFSINFGIHLLMIARYGVQLEKGPFDRRTADFLWMMTFGALVLLVLSAIPLLENNLPGISLVFMLLYVWSREFPDVAVNLYGIVSLRGFYLPWAMLVVDVIFGAPILLDLLGIIAGHIYYFLTVLYPLSSGKNLLKTPLWMHRLVAKWRIGEQMNSPSNVAGGATSANRAFSGRSYRLDR